MGVRLTVVLSLTALASGVAVGWGARSLVLKPKIIPSKSEVSSSANSNYPLLDPMRALRPQADFVVEFDPLRAQLQQMVDTWAAKGVIVAVQLAYLNTGSYLSINQNYRMLPASLTKVPVAMMVMHRVEKGQLTMDQELEVTAEDRDSKWGDWYKEPVGTKHKLAEVIQKSLVESDNTAHHMLYRLVGLTEARDLSQELNLEELFDEQGRITAREYARLLLSLYSSSYLDPENSQLILNYLTRDQLVKFLIRGFGKDVLYAHKFGESASVRSYLDAGIVYIPNRPFVIVVMVHDEEGKVGLTREMAGTEIFEPIAKMTYAAMIGKSK